MAKKPAGKRTTESQAYSDPVFPYTNKPSSLRRLLADIPRKPRPKKLDQTLMKSWDFKDNNDLSVLRVLKALHLLNDKSEPTELYAKFMDINDGPSVLGQEVRRVYAPLFEASLEPHKDSNDKLRSLFNIHSGGGERLLELQVQTFKALCDHARFDSTTAVTTATTKVQEQGSIAASSLVAPALGSGAVININLHIHLPENKTSRDYERIIEDIGIHLFGRKGGEARD